MSCGIWAGRPTLGRRVFPRLPSPTWRLAASADVNQDGAPDLIWHNSATGQNAVWYLNGASVVGYSELPTVPDSRWRLMAALDINNDGAPEMIWRHDNGGNYVWSWMEEQCERCLFADCLGQDLADDRR